MYLDAYYRMLHLSQCIKHSLMSQIYYFDEYIDIPAMQLCNGESVTKFYRGIVPVNGGASAQYSNCAARSTFAAPTNSMVSQVETISPSYANIIVGNGTTPTTKTDYMIENEIVTGLEGVAVVKRCSATDGTIEFSKTMENISDQEITVSEIGLSWCYPNATSGSLYPQILVYREVLPEPIVVAPGESFTVKIKHEFAMP